MIEIQYEELTENPEKVTRELADFCAIEWFEDMLHPDANTRTVLTPSILQVRQPLYRTSVERWKRYEPWLGPFRELLSSGEK